MKLGAALATCSLIILAACSSPPPTTEETAPTVPVVEQSPSAGGTPTPAASSSADPAAIKQYFELFATNDPDEMEKAIKLAAPKSPAAAYMIHQSATQAAELDAGAGSDEPETAEATAEGYEVCGSDGDSCYKYTDLKTSGGKLSSFSVNGNAIGPRLTLGRGDKVRAGGLATVEFISAYKAASGDLYVNLTIRSKSRAINLNQLYGARYRDPSGRQVKARDAYLTDDLDPKSRMGTTVVFRKAKTGGVVSIEIVDAKSYSSATAKVKI